MPNKDKETMDYWKHSTILFDEIKMKMLKASVKIKGYYTYCYLMERINRMINEPFILDKNMKDLILAELEMDCDTFDNILNKMLELDIFEKQPFEDYQILTNSLTRDNKDLVKETRARKKKYMAEKRSIDNVDVHNEQEVFCKDKDIEIDKDKERDINKDIDKDKLFLVVNGETITTKNRVYDIVSKILNNDSLDQSQKNIIDQMFNVDRIIFARTLETCQNLPKNSVDASYLVRTFANLRKDQSLYEKEEIERLKRLRREKKNNSELVGEVIG